MTLSEKGTGQGAVISPLLANVYLHSVIDLWAMQRRRREAKGDMIVVRYADDLVLGFEPEADARRFREALRARLEAFALSLHPDKTRPRIAVRGSAATRRRTARLAGSASRRPSTSSASPSSAANRGAAGS